MKIDDIINEAVVDPFVYHGTSRSYLPEIARQGLIPNKPGPEGWPEFDDDHENDEWDDENEEWIVSDEPREPEHPAFQPRIFGSDHFFQAKEYADNYPDGVVLRMPNDYQWEHGETDFPYLVRTMPIPANQIEVLCADGNWYPLLSLKV